MFSAEHKTWVRQCPVKRARKKLGLSTKQIAGRVDFSVSLVKMIENGDRSLVPSKLERLAEALECNPITLRLELDIWTALKPVINKT